MKKNKIKALGPEQLEREIRELKAGRRRVEAAERLLNQKDREVTKHNTISAKTAEIHPSSSRADWILPVSLVLILMAVLGVIVMLILYLSSHPIVIVDKQIIEHNITKIVENPTVYRTINNITNVVATEKIIKQEFDLNKVGDMTCITSKDQSGDIRCRWDKK